MKGAGNDRSTKSLCDPTPFYFHVWDTECCDSTDCQWHRFSDNTPTYVLIAECCQRLYKTRTCCFLFWLDTFRKDAYAQFWFWQPYLLPENMSQKDAHLNFKSSVDFSKNCPKCWLFLKLSKVLAFPKSVQSVDFSWPGVGQLTC